ncbi:LysR family transcriptional regulator [Pseudoduganella namucuonensis]|uniref:Transcriptional regulator, LysR family n=1 Tax=Pseudoduganella namucuonensis TaxID=1035707 RepID=A0A1I7L893_9BURK|nr:LysR family transcriptional regulator [Pseudoduganella namucuonensis]SFV05949.1 transcriptional regulator, LysR family [Pseudoduganella namucuonensis]
MSKEVNSSMFHVDAAPEIQERFDGVTVFVEVVRLGGFARAAEYLGLTRSAVGKAMARLEARLSTRLFHRTTRVQNLTDDGQIYYEHCLRALAELQAAAAQMESGRHEVAGRLHVSMPVLFGRHCVAPVLLNLARRHSSLELNLSFSDRPVDVLAEGFDLAIRCGVLGAESEGLRARKLVTHGKRVCASPAYLAAHGRPRSTAELATHSILLYRRADRINVWQLADATGRIVDVPLASRLQLDDLEAIADAAAAGLGLAWLPEWLVRERLRAGELVSVLDDLPGATTVCHAVWPSAPHMPLRLRLAVDALVEQLPKEAGAIFVDDQV